MSKKKAEIPADMWLHVATDALARYVAGGGIVTVDATTDGVVVRLDDVVADDARLAPAFVGLLDTEAAGEAAE